MARPVTRTLVIGEALIDAVDNGPEGPSEHVGGSPANVAFGLGALGHDVALATWLGQDQRGRRIADRCREVGVLLTAGSDGAERTSVAHAFLDSSGQARYDFELTWRLPEVTDLESFGHVHTGSIGATLEPGGTQVLATVRSAQPTSTISYDPNVRPTLMDGPDAVRGRMEELIALADVVKASDEDIAWLYPDLFVPDVLRRWGSLGASLTVVTRGREGALYALSHVGAVDISPAPAIEVADTVGAGDSFMAGLLSGLLDAGLLGGPQARERLAAGGVAEVRPAIERAVRTSAITVGATGAYAPGRGELGA
jgi:fructokinase